MSSSGAFLLCHSSSASTVDKSELHRGKRSSLCAVGVLYTAIKLSMTAAESKNGIFQRLILFYISPLYIAERGGDKAGEQRMRAVRAALELRMELNADEERAVA